MTPYPANFNPRRKGVWVNPEIDFGFKLLNRRAVNGWFGRIKIVYDYLPLYDHPLHWLQDDGTRIAAGAFDRFDWGSIPLLAQSRLPRDGSLAYIPHDFIYRTGGAFIRYKGEKEWKFRTVSRSASDALLQTQVQCDPVAPVGAYRAASVWVAVRSLGWTAYDEWTADNDAPTWPTDDPPDVDDPPPIGV